MEDELIHELCPGYALDALGPEDERAFEDHLATCPRCREELAAFADAAAALGRAAPPHEPPPELRGRILGAARAERVNVVPFRQRRLVPALAAIAAVAACTAIGLGVWAATLQGQGGTRSAALQAIPLRGASGTLLRARDGSATLVVSGLRRAPGGKTYEAWVITSGRAAPAGLFSGSAPTVVLRLRRHVPRGAVVGVTVERAGGARRPTGSPIFTSAVA